MATKYFRLKLDDWKAVIGNKSTPNSNLIKPGYCHASFVIPADQYDADDVIQIRLEGANGITGVVLTDLTSGGPILLNDTTPISSYTKGTGDTGGGYYVQTAPMNTPVKIGVSIDYTLNTAFRNEVTLTDS
jgi:hypothetical protein